MATSTTTHAPAGRVDLQPVHAADFCPGVDVAAFAVVQFIAAPSRWPRISIDRRCRRHICFDPDRPSGCARTILEMPVLLVAYSGFRGGDYRVRRTCCAVTHGRRTLCARRLAHARRCCRNPGRLSPAAAFANRFAEARRAPSPISRPRRSSAGAAFLPGESPGAREIGPTRRCADRCRPRRD